MLLARLSLIFLCFQVKILISYKADLSLKDHEGCTPLHLACGSSLDSAMELQTTIVVENLTSHGAGVNAKVGNILVINFYSSLHTFTALV